MNFPRMLLDMGRLFLIDVLGPRGMAILALCFFGAVALVVGFFAASSAIRAWRYVVLIVKVVVSLVAIAYALQVVRPEEGWSAMVDYLLGDLWRVATGQSVVLK